jgi:hypothetical protein
VDAKNTSTPISSSVTSVLSTRRTERNAPADWRDRLMRRLQKLAPDGFERLCQRVLRESGFVEVRVTGRSGDGGIPRDRDPAHAAGR